MDPNRRKGLKVDVCRFRDHISVTLGTGETTYLTPTQARKLGKALYAAAYDIDRQPFAESKLQAKLIPTN